MKFLQQFSTTEQKDAVKKQMISTKRHQPAYAPNNMNPLPSHNVLLVGSYQIKIKALVVVLFVSIKPDFSKSNRVLLKNIGASAPCIWATGSKNVPNMWTQHLL